jgi:hypothetical protein
MSLVAFLLGGYLGGLLCILLTLRDTNTLSVSAIGGAIIWPVAATIEVTAIAVPIVKTVVGYVKSTVSWITALVNKVRGK